MQQLTEFLDNLYTTTWQNMKSDAADNIFDATPFYFHMKDMNKMEPVEGGRWIGEPIVFDKNDQITWISKGGTVTLADFEHLTVAKYDWRYLVAPIVRFGIDDQQNRGKNAIMSLINSKIETTNLSLEDTLETTLFAGSGAATDAMDGLQLLVPDDPTSSTSIGGINQSTNTWWRSKTDNMTGVSFATSGIDRMRTMYNNVSQNKRNSAPTIIMSGQTPFEYYEDNAVTNYYRINNNKLADAGFETLNFKGVPMAWSPACANTRMYFLNGRHLKIVFDPMLFMDMTEWKAIPAQPNDRAAQIMSAMQLVTNRRRVHGVMHTIDTA